MAEAYVSLGEIATKLRILHIRCDRCGRAGRYSTRRLVREYGADTSIEPLQNDMTADCPRRTDPEVELGAGCAPLCPDLSKIV
jgi:hypothetical protein